MGEPSATTTAATGTGCGCCTAEPQTDAEQVQSLLARRQRIERSLGDLERGDTLVGANR